MDYSKIKQLIGDNEYDNALQQINELIEKNIVDDELLYWKGKIHQRLSQWDDAVAAYQKSIELNADSKAVVALEMLNNILNSLNNNIIST